MAEMDPRGGSGSADAPPPGATESRRGSAMSTTSDGALVELSPEEQAEQEQLREQKALAEAAAAAEQEAAATAIQAVLRSRNARRTSNGQRAAARLEKKRQMAAEAAARALAQAEAERLAERQRIAEEKYAEADVDGDESVSKEELGSLISQMLREQGVSVDDKVVAEFVLREWESADEDHDGTVSFDEFCAYYNRLLDQLQGAQKEALIKGLRDHDAAVSAEKASEMAARQLKADVRDMGALMRLIALLTHPSVGPVSGTQLLFERGGEKGVRPEQPPSDNEVRTTHGLVFELSKFGQRLITPWGAYVISYSLTFEGYNEESPRAAAEEAALFKMNTESFYFVLCRINSPLLHFKKLPERTHFAVTSCGGLAVPVGHVLGELETPISAQESLDLKARFEAALAAAAVPDLSFCADPFLVNTLLGRTVHINERLLAPLESRLKKSKTRPKMETLRTALELGDNDIDAALRLRQEHLKSIDKLVSARKGYSTREHCDEVLSFCHWDVDAALFVLNNQKAFEATCNELGKRKGLASGLGFPSKDEIRWEVALARNDSAAAIRAIMRQWHIEVRIMRDIVQYAPVDSLLNEMPPHERPPRAHVEGLLHAHAFDVPYVAHLLSDCAFILRHAAELGNPSRERVEELVIHFDFDEHKVRNYLKSVEYIYRARRQVGSPSKAEIEHYLERTGYELKAAVKLMKLVYRFINPEPPRNRYVVPRKVDGRLIKHIAHDTELLHKGAVTPWARRAVEVAIDATADPESKEVNEEEAIAFLVKVSRLSKEVPHLPRWELEYAVSRSYVLDRDDGKVMLDETMAQWRKFDSFVASVQHLGSPDRQHVAALLERLGHDQDAVRQTLADVDELGRLNAELDFGMSPEQLDKLYTKHGRNLQRASAYMTGMHALKAEAPAFGNPPMRALEGRLAEHDLDHEKAARHLASAFELSHDREFLADAGQPSAADIERALALCDYECESTKVMLLNVARLKIETERWGAPTREHVEEVLVAAKLDKAAAFTQLKEEHRKAQFGVFRDEQAERKEREVAEREAQRIILADDPKAKEKAEEAAKEAARLAEAVRQEAEAAEAAAKAQAEADAVAEKARLDEEKRAIRLAAIDGPKPKELVKRRASQTEDKDVNTLNAERLEKIAALQKSLEAK